MILRQALVPFGPRTGAIVSASDVALLPPGKRLRLAHIGAISIDRDTPEKRERACRASARPLPKASTSSPKPASSQMARSCGPGSTVTPHLGVKESDETLATDCALCKRVAVKAVAASDDFGLQLARERDSGSAGGRRTSRRAAESLWLARARSSAAGYGSSRAAAASGWCRSTCASSGRSSRQLGRSRLSSAWRSSRASALGQMTAVADGGRELRGSAATKAVVHGLPELPAPVVRQESPLASAEASRTWLHP